MRNLFFGALAVAAGIYAEKKYNVSGMIAEQVRKYTGVDLLGDEDHESMAEAD